MSCRAPRMPKFKPVHRPTAVSPIEVQLNAHRIGPGLFIRKATQVKQGSVQQQF